MKGVLLFCCDPVCARLSEPWFRSLSYPDCQFDFFVALPVDGEDLGRNDPCSVKEVAQNGGNYGEAHYFCQ